VRFALPLAKRLRNDSETLNNHLPTAKHMKISARVAVAATLLIVIGTVVAVYSYTQLQGQDVLFNQDSILIDGHIYIGYEIIVNLDGKFALKVIGGVGSIESGVDFYLVNDTSWNSWVNKPRIAFRLLNGAPERDRGKLAIFD
jgi:NAD-dependent SIR2 family protein deacetylase